VQVKYLHLLHAVLSTTYYAEFDVEFLYLITHYLTWGYGACWQHLFRRHFHHSEVVSDGFSACWTVMWWFPSCNLYWAVQQHVGQSHGQRHSLKW